MINLTKNEKEILKLLLGNGRIHDSKIAEKLNISTQAVGKIRKGLEDKGVIEGYSCNLNFEKLGINHFAIIKTKINPGWWENYNMEETKKLTAKDPSSIFCVNVHGGEEDLISLHGFRDAKELEEYLHQGRLQLKNLIDIVKVYSFSSNSLIKLDPFSVI